MSELEQNIVALELFIDEALLIEAEFAASLLEREIGIMRISGMGEEAIKEVLDADFAAKGRIFGQIENATKAHTAGMLTAASNSAQQEVYSKAGASDLRRWVVVNLGPGAVTKPCPDCPERQDRVEPIEVWQAIGEPGSGWSICRQHCYCILVPEQVKISGRVDVEKAKKPMTPQQRMNELKEKAFNDTITPVEQEELKGFFSKSTILPPKGAKPLKGKAENILSAPITEGELFENASRKYFSGIDIDDFSLMQRYTGPAYLEYNAALRVGSQEGIQIGNKISGILESAPKFKGTTFRGIAFDTFEEVEKYMDGSDIGSVFSDAGFMSTTLNRRIAENFTGASGVLLKIKSKSGVLISPVSSFADEVEVLFDYGKTFRVSKINKDLFEISLEEI